MPVLRGCEAPWYVLSREAWARIRQLGAAVTIIGDFGRPYRYSTEMRQHLNAPTISVSLRMVKSLTPPVL
jgi:hypothetical protein